MGYLKGKEKYREVCVCWVKMHTGDIVIACERWDGAGEDCMLGEEERYKGWRNSGVELNLL